MDVVTTHDYAIWLYINSTTINVFMENNLDRRAFFTQGLGKAAEVITKHAVEKARKNAENWIRPPFAIEEFDFLIACNRCGDCIDACQYGVIFPLASRLGGKVFATPAMDLNNQACHLCEDWPCVQACETTALKSPFNKTNDESVIIDEISAKQLPEIAIVSINVEACLPYNGPECGACHVCPVENAMSWVMEKPSINTEYCIGCALCRDACIVEPKAINVKSKYKS